MIIVTSFWKQSVMEIVIRWQASSDEHENQEPWRWPPSEHKAYPSIKTDIGEVITSVITMFPAETTALRNFRCSVFLIERIYSGLLGNQQGIRLSAGYQRELLNLYVQFSIMVTTRKTSVNIDPSTSLTMILTIQISINGPGTSSASLPGFIRHSFNYK